MAKSDSVIDKLMSMDDELPSVEWKGMNLYFKQIDIFAQQDVVKIAGKWADQEMKVRDPEDKLKELEPDPDELQQVSAATAKLGQAGGEDVKNVEMAKLEGITNQWELQRHIIFNKTSTVLLIVFALRDEDGNQFVKDDSGKTNLEETRKWFDYLIANTSLFMALTQVLKKSTAEILEASGRKNEQ